MKTIRSRLIFILAIFLFLSIVGAAITIYSLSKQKSDGMIINLAGKQRMLTQKMSKESLALGQGTGSKGPLEKTINQFDRTLKGLISGDNELGLPPTQNTEIVNQLNRVQKLWNDFQANLNVVLSNSAEANAALSYVSENNITLLNEMAKTVDMLEKKSSSPAIINLAGKQRMLTQKMVKEILGLVKGGTSDNSLKSTANLFDKTLKGLISGDRSLGLISTQDSAILAQLTIVQTLWNTFNKNIDTILSLVPETNNALAYINIYNIELLNEMNKAVEMYEKKSKEKMTITIWISIIIVVVVLVTVVLTWSIIIHPLIETLNEVVGRVKDIAKGDLKNKLDIDRNDEIGKLSESVNQMVDNFVEVEKQADIIAAGDYSNDIIPRSDKDELGKALQRMTKTLRDISAENEKQNWLKTGQNELNDKMRGDLDTRSLSMEVIFYLSKYLGAQIGTLYVVENDNELKLSGSYAVTKGKNFKNTIKVGEGLVGQAALEKEMITMTGIPEDTVGISSTYVDSTSYNIVVTPFTYEGKLLGVIELGSFKVFSSRSLEFLSIVMRNIAINTNTANAQTKLKELLEKTQVQSEELQSQQEELRVSNEELTEQTNALKVSEEELKTQQEELQVTNEELEEKTQMLEEKNQMLQ